MGMMSYVQSSFLGGFWSKSYQGRIDSPRYPTAMKESFNGYPVEEGAWTRRSGTQFLATSRSGAAGRLIPFNFSETAPYNMEFTANHLRFFTGTALVKTNDPNTVASISTANPAVVETSAANAWVTADQIEFVFAAANRADNAPSLRHRQFEITVIDTFHFSIADPITGLGVDGATLGFNPNDLTPIPVARILDIPTPWGDGVWPLLRSVQSDFQSDVVIKTQAILLTGGVPYLLTCTETPGNSIFAEFNLAVMPFVDGPYLDPVNGAFCFPFALDGTAYAPPTPSTGIANGLDGGTAYLVAQTGINANYLSPTPVNTGGGGYVRLNFAANSWLAGTVYGVGDVVSTSGGGDWQSQSENNVGHDPDSDGGVHWLSIVSGSFFGLAGLNSDDVGRSIRLYSAPDEWDSTTNFPATTPIMFNGIPYTALVTNTNVEPDTNPTTWEINLNLARWTWGFITAVNAAGNCDVNIQGPSLLYDGNINTFQIGAYGTNPGYPTCGTYYQGRAWLGGAHPNRADASVSNDIETYSPTGPDGTVADNNGLSYILDSDTQNPIFWFQPQPSSLAFGTQEGEWVMQASSTNEPITPTSITVQRATKYGSKNILPIRTPLSTVFVQKYGRKVMEMIADVFTGKFSAPNLTLSAKSVTQDTVAELAYQEELDPIIWARTGTGQPIGCTYRRVSSFATEDPTFVGWHTHGLGTGRFLESIVVGPDETGTLEVPAFVTNIVPSNIRWVENFQNKFEEYNDLWQAWFLDGAAVPSAAVFDDVAGIVRFYGLWNLNGTSPTAFIGGMDLGEWPVVNGEMDVPIGTNGLTLDTVIALNAAGITYTDRAIQLDHPTSASEPIVNVPATIMWYEGVRTNIKTGTGFGGGTLGYPSWDGGFFIRLAHAQGIFAGVMWHELNNGKLLAEINATQLGLDPIEEFIGVSDGNACVERNSGDIYINTTVNILRLGLDATDPAGPHVLQLSKVYDGEEGGTIFTSMAASSAFVWGAGNLGHEVFLYNMSGDIGDALNTFSTNEHDMILTPYPGASSHIGEVFGIGTWDQFNHSDAFPDQTTIYHFSAESDAGWMEQVTIPCTRLGISHFSEDGPTDIVMDQSTGDLLIVTIEKGTERRVLSKVRQNGEVAWNYTFPNNGVGVQIGNFRKSNVANGFFSFLEDRLGEDTIVHVLELLETGPVDRTYPVSVLNVAGGQTSDDSGRNLIVFAGFEKSGDAVLNPIFTTPNSFTDEWANIRIGNAIGGGNIAGGGGEVSLTRYVIPGVVGYPYTSRGALLSPSLQAQSGAQAGPGVGKKKRSHKYVARLIRAINNVVSIGTDPTRLDPMLFVDEGGTPLDQLTFFDGVHRSAITSTYNFDNGLTWEITRPYPLIVTQMGGFLETTDV